MFKAKEVSLQNIAVYLTLSLVAAAGVVMFRPHQIVSQSAPIFMGEEVTVSKTVALTPAVSLAKPATVSMAKDSTVVKVVPAPQPQAVPLPIVPPSIASSVLPVYPAKALADGTEGLVLLSVYVGLTGQPEKIETKTSSGYTELDAAAAQAVAQWKFFSATQGGAALGSWFEIPVRFVIK
jgi:TonB family protein